MKKWIPSTKTLRIVRKVLTYLLFAFAGLTLWVQQSNQGERINDLRNEVESVRFESKVEKGKFFELRKNFAGITGVENGAEILFRLDGSNSIGGELAPALAAGYLKEMGAVGPVKIAKSKKRPGYVIVKANIPGQEWPQGIEINGKGSLLGFRALANRQAQISMSSRKISGSEVSYLKSKGKRDMGDKRAAHTIALDGVSIIVHPTNPITSMTKKQIREVFSGEIRDWILIGGGNGRIKPYVRKEGSGTRQFFRRVAMQDEEFVNSAKGLRDNQSIHDAVLKDKNAIGFVALPYIGKTKAIAILGDNKVPIHPFSSSVEQGDYLLKRKLYLYAPPKMENFFASEFIQFSQSDAGRKIVSNTGYVAPEFSEVKEFSEENIENLPEEFAKIIKSSEQLNLSFRFKPGKVALDVKSEKDLIRLNKFISDNKNSIKNIHLVGLSDNAGQADENLRLSIERSKYLKLRLMKMKLAVKENQIIVTGFGDVKPVAPNTTEAGRNKNRRVEIWVDRK